MNFAIIGYGTIASIALETIARELKRPLDLVSICTKNGGNERARAMLEPIGPKLANEFLVTNDLNEIIKRKPLLIAEAAGHESLHSFGASILAAGTDLIVTSVGALADNALRTQLDSAATSSGAHYMPVSGAIGALDILAAAKLSGLESVTYSGRKPPQAWKGSRAEKLVDLDQLDREVTFFDDNAGTAAKEYPQNANVAATLALAGLGFERTRVRLIADPAIKRNVHEITVRAACADFTFRVEGFAAPDNPKTSLTVAYSLASAILQRLQPD